MISKGLKSNLHYFKSITQSPLWAMVAAFGCYFCVYGFRKPFTAGIYENQFWHGIQWKSVLISSQIAGYMLSKWCGIFFVSSIRREQRAKAIILSILIAELALLGFGLVPHPYQFIFLVLNGLPLGMIFGYIQGYLEGKKTTELLIASLGASFILADGVSKSVGSWLLNLHVPENWMPFTAGLIYIIPLLAFVFMLTKIPQPTQADIELRSERIPMTQVDRINLVKKLGPGILGISLLYLFTALLRGVRSDFAPEIWKNLGYENDSSIFSQSEIWVMVGVLAINSALVLIKKNKLAFNISLYTILFGFILLVVSSVVGTRYFNGFWLIVLTGFGIYIPYLTITTSVFERLISITRDKANIGFLMYIVDSIGYLGYNCLMLLTGFFLPPGAIVDFFFQWTGIFGMAGIVISIVNWLYFQQKMKSV